MIRIMFVCTGNICRSPTAHGVLEKMVTDAGLQDQVQVDSAGTHSYHMGEAPDGRSQIHAKRRGYDLSRQRARQLRAKDFEDFDLILVMDSANEVAARQIAPPEHLNRMHRLTDFCSHFPDTQVPDPYYGGDKGFEHVLDLVEDACTGVMNAVRDKQ